MRKVRRITIPIVIVPLLVLAIASSFFVARILRTTTSRLPEVVQSALSERINGEVRIGAFEARAMGVVALRDVQIIDSHTKQTVMFIPTIEVSYSIADILSGKSKPTESIRSIEILRPKLLLERDSNGKWNVTRLLKPTSGRQRLFNPKIRATSASITLRDYAGRGKKAEENHLEHVNAFIDLANPQLAKFSVSGQGLSNRLRRFTVSGRYGSDNRAIKASLNLVGANISYLASYQPKSNIQVISGIANVSLNLSRPTKNDVFQYDGRVSLDSAAVKLRKIKTPVNDINGKIVLKNNVAELDLEGRVASTHFLLFGKVFELSRPTLALTVSSDNTNYRELIGALGFLNNIQKARMPSTGRFRASITGMAKSPSVSFVMSAPHIAYDGWAGHSVVTEGTYSKGQIEISRLRAESCGGIVAGVGKVRFSGNPKMAFRGQVNDAILSQVPVLQRQVEGKTSGSLYVSYGNDGIRVAYQGLADKGRFRRYEFSDGRIDLGYVNGKLSIRKSSARVLGGTLSGTGDIEHGNMNLRLSGSGINLAYVKDLFWSATTVGRLNFEGGVTGNFESPIFNGSVECERVMISDIGFQHLAATITLRRDRLGIHELSIREGEEEDLGSIRASGYIQNPFAKVPSLDLHIEADSIDAGRLGHLLHSGVPFTGLLFANVDVLGSTRYPRIKGEIGLIEGYYQELPIDTCSARIAYDGRRLRVEEIHLRSGESFLTGSGDLSREKQLSFEFTGERIDISRYTNSLLPYLSVAGELAIQGTIEGATSSPHLTARIESSDIAVNGQHLGKITGMLQWQDAALDMRNVTLQKNESEYSIPHLRYDSASRMFTVIARTQGVHAATLLSVLDASPAIKQADKSNSKLHRFVKALPRPLTGRIDTYLAGTVAITDEGAVPNLHGEITASEVQLGRSTVGSIQMEGSWSNDVVTINKVEALDTDTNVVAEGTIGPAGALDLQIDAHNLPVGAFQQWIKPRENIFGRADVTIVASGSISRPIVEASVEIAKPRLGQFEFDRIRSRLSADGNEETRDDMGNTTGRIDINDLTFVMGDRKLEATGFIPIDWQNFAIPKDGRILLESHLDSGSLDILSKMTGLSVETEYTGAFDGALKLAGTIASPSYTGYLTWRGGRLRIPQINEPFVGIDAEMKLDGDKLSVVKISGQSNEGGNFIGSGTVNLAGLDPVLDLEVKADKLRMSAQNLTNKYGEDVRAAVDANLIVTGNWKKPKVSGDVSVPEGTLVLRSSNRKIVSHPKPSVIDPEFDIKAALGRHVQFRSARLTTPMKGELTLLGSLARPRVNGILNLDGGSILFPTRELRMQPGSALRLQSSSDNRIQALVDIQAQTKLTTTTNLGQRRRYIVTMVASGSLDNLNPVFNSSPPGLTEQRIVALLAGQGDLEQILGPGNGNNFGKQLSGLFSTAIMPTVFDPIEEAFESTLGFEEFSLEMGYREPLQLTIGDRLLDNLYLDYTATLGARPDYADSSYQFKLSYRFKDALELGISTDDQQRTTIGIEGRLRF